MNQSFLAVALCLATGLAASVALAIPAAQPPQTHMIRGATRSIGQGRISSYVLLDRQNHVTELGVILPESALTNLPAAETEYDLSLPSVADRLPFTHVAVNWNPHGHPPAPIYGNAHFDFHFFTITQGDRHHITVRGADQPITYKTPAPALVPAGYVMAPDSGIPGEGSHWINPQAPEFQGTPHGFDKTFIYGFYNGKMVFVEPMLAMDFLQQHQSFSEAVSLPAQYSKPGLYPTEYGVTYDAQHHEFRVVLSKLVSRAAADR